MKKIVVLGSTGSIGTQALEVISRNPDRFSLEAIAAGRNADLLIEQAIKHRPPFAVIADTSGYLKVKQALSEYKIKVMAGSEAIKEIATLPSADMILAAFVGFYGLAPVIAAIQAGKKIALANKETLVVAGELITGLAKKHNAEIYPVDSEHSAIFQCLAGEDPDTVEKLILTASGGPFRGMKLSQLEKMTYREALKHPNWCMGKKVTIDSATLMNKGLEMIEARWLFNISPSKIEVIIHPQSVIHSMVQFTDGAVKAQLGVPDMRLPIQYALSFPSRLDTSYLKFDFALYPRLTFEPPDRSVFRCLALAYEAINRGGNMPCIMNAANEAVVEAFLVDKVKFCNIPGIIGHTMENMEFIEHPVLEEYYTTHAKAKEFTESCINS
jgi:1-deoxy-D-xylulose-5-phosphate reductoisomerase